ncbi:MAG: hypothetical protein HYV62_05975 [Candidatus Rokubacteria bacterium]|nr:hypothetical protein [Candidatus Rokubacteria bacterium]
MSPGALRNFHVPLPEDLYRVLRDEAASAKRPATVLARHAIEAWLRQKKKAALREAIAAYAAAHAGSEADLDPALEAASLELWGTPKRSRR